MTSDNSLPSNEPIVVDPGSGEFRLLHDVDSDFTRLSNLNFPNTYHQEETRATFNYIRQLSDRVSLTELFGYRKIQYKFIDDLGFVGAPFDVASQTLTLFGFEQQSDENIVYQELRFNITPDLGETPNNVIAGWSYEDTSGFVIGNFIFSRIPIPSGFRSTTPIRSFLGGISGSSLSSEDGTMIWEATDCLFSTPLSPVDSSFLAAAATTI